MDYISLLSRYKNKNNMNYVNIIIIYEIKYNKLHISV